MNFLKINKKSKAFISLSAKITAIVLSASLVAQGAAVNAAVGNYQVVNSYTAPSNGVAVINNLKYTDMGSAPYDLKDAVYQNGALDLLKGFGNQRFNPNGAVSKEFALYLVYMAANRAKDIATQGQALNAARATDAKKTNLQEILNDGAIQLALNEGLITQQQYADAMNTDQASLEAGSFKRNSAVQRQDFGTWLAKTLMLPPVYEQQELFNNYSDWKSATPENVPYLEAILLNNIMSGDGKGKFNPTQAVTRAQAARILKNAEDTILPVRKMEKRTATIEDIQSTKDTSKGYRIDYVTYVVRNSDGLLDEIKVEARYQKPSSKSNELTAKAIVSSRTEIPVFKNGTITNSSSLKKGDQMEYIVGTDDKIVRYARVLSNTGEIKYKAAVLNSSNYTSRTMNITPLMQTIKYPTDDISNPVKKTYTTGDIVYENYSYSNSVLNAVSKAPMDVTSIMPDTVVIVGIKKDVITEIVPITLKKEREGGLVAGIVEENNPDLGYLTLYNEDGTGSTLLEASSLRTFNYADPNSVEVYKDHVPAELEDIEAGDTVFVRLDEDGAVSSISGVDNYTIIYGKVINKKISTITVKTDKGDITYSTDGASVLKNGKLTKLSQLKDGDWVKLVVNQAPNTTKLKEITIEQGDKLVSNIYKGTFDSYNETKKQVLLKDPWVFRKGNWVKDDSVSFKTVKLGDNFTAFYDGSQKTIKDMNKYLKGSIVYIVSERDYGKDEYAVMASFINSADKEMPYNDKVYTASTTKFTLQQAQVNIAINNGTIVVKDGRLVQGSSVTANDDTYVMANRDADTNSLVAGVVTIEQRPGVEAAQLYRGRISSINEYNSVTLQSYSKLNGTNWEFANTPITFTLNSNTRITDTDGIVGQGDFNTYNGTNTFKDRTIYILSDGTNAVEISTAPYGNINVQGEVITVSGGTFEEDGTIMAEPTTLELRNCRYYNSSANLWVNMADSKFDLLTNSLILKNNQRIKASELKRGDKLRVLKMDNTTAGNAYIVIVEE